MENLAIYAVTALNLLAVAFIWFKMSDMGSILMKIRSLERGVQAEFDSIREEIPKAEISLAGQILEATDLVETVRHTQAKMKGRKGGSTPRGGEPQLDYMDPSLPREVRMALLAAQSGGGNGLQ